MIKTDTPPRGSFDHLLTPLRDDAWRDTGFDPPPRRELKEAMPGAPPPTPPEREGGNLRVRVEIEIVERRTAPQPQQRGYRFGTLTLWLLVVAVLATLAGCAPPQPIKMSAACGADPVCRANPSWYDNATGLGELQGKRQRAADEVARAKRWADPAYRARWQAMMDTQEQQLLAYYRAHPEADPANSVINCQSVPGNRFECSNFNRTVLIEGSEF